MSMDRKKEVSFILKSYDSTKRLATPQIVLRESTEDFKKPMTAST